MLWPLHILHVYSIETACRILYKYPINACRAELGLYPLIIKIHNRDVKIPQPPKGQRFPNHPSQSSNLQGDEPKEESCQPASPGALFTNRPHRAPGQQHNYTQPNIPSQSVDQCDSVDMCYSVEVCCYG